VSIIAMIFFIIDNYSGLFFLIIFLITFIIIAINLFGTNYLLLFEGMAAPGRARRRGAVPCEKASA
jgi:hypothetical protein